MRLILSFKIGYIILSNCQISRDPPSNFLPVHNYKTGIKPFTGSKSIVPKDTIGVCVKPLHFTYNKTMELLQFIELNRILGVSRYLLIRLINEQLEQLGIQGCPCGYTLALHSTNILGSQLGNQWPHYYSATVKGHEIHLMFNIFTFLQKIRT